jgi:hypothetical protein
MKGTKKADRAAKQKAEQDVLGERYGNPSDMVTAKGYKVVKGKKAEAVSVVDPDTKIEVSTVHRDADGWLYVTNIQGKTRRAGSWASVYHWLSTTLPLTASKRASEEKKPGTAKTKRARKMARKPAEFAPIQKVAPRTEKTCPMCGGVYFGRNRTCSKSCADKRSAEASELISEQMRERKGAGYKAWKEACDSHSV